MYMNMVLWFAPLQASPSPVPVPQTEHFDWGTPAAWVSALCAAIGVSFTIFSVYKSRKAGEAARSAQKTADEAKTALENIAVSIGFRGAITWRTDNLTVLINERLRELSQQRSGKPRPDASLVLWNVGGGNALHVRIEGINCFAAFVLKTDSSDPRSFVFSEFRPQIPSCTSADVMAWYSDENFDSSDSRKRIKITWNMWVGLEEVEKVQVFNLEPHESYCWLPDTPSNRKLFK